jgi:hypothetical protein
VLSRVERSESIETPFVKTVIKNYTRHSLSQTLVGH